MKRFEPLGTLNTFEDLFGVPLFLNSQEAYYMLTSLDWAYEWCCREVNTWHASWEFKNTLRI